MIFPIAFVGDGRSNMGNSLMIAGCLMGMDVRIGAPRQLWPDDELLEYARELEKMNKGTLTLTEDPKEAVRGVQFIHTDVWVSMGEPAEVWAAADRSCSGPTRSMPTLWLPAAIPECVSCIACPRSTTLKPRSAGRYTSASAWKPWRSPMRCSNLTAGIQFEQAENRVHSIKALLVATLGSQ